MADFVSGDTGTTLRFNCKDADEVAINLLDCTVQLHWLEPTGTVANRTMTIEDAAAGRCSYKFLAGEITAPSMEFEIEITDSSGFKLTNPELVTEEVRKRLL